MGSVLFIAFLAFVMVLCGFTSLYYVVCYDLMDLEATWIIFGCILSMFIVNFLLTVFGSFLKFV